MSGSPLELSPREVAERLGVAVTTLRSWHTRYGLGPSGHRPGQHRRYTQSDLGRLELMVQLTGGGMPAARAARMVEAYFSTGTLPAVLPGWSRRHRPPAASEPRP